MPEYVISQRDPHCARDPANPPKFYFWRDELWETWGGKESAMRFRSHLKAQRKAAELRRRRSYDRQIAVEPA